MFNIDFKTLQEAKPEYKDIWNGVEKWITSNPADYIDICKLSREIEISVSSFNLAMALSFLKETCKLKQNYKVLDRDVNEFLNVEYEHFSDIPEEHFEKNKLVVPIFKQ